MADFLSTLAAGGVIRIETTLLPPIDIPLGNNVGEPSTAIQFLKPRITLLSGGYPTLSVAPAGDPSEGLPWGLLIVGVVALLLVFSFSRS